MFGEINKIKNNHTRIITRELGDLASSADIEKCELSLIDSRLTDDLMGFIMFGCDFVKM